MRQACLPHFKAKSLVVSDKEIYLQIYLDYVKHVSKTLGENGQDCGGEKYKQSWRSGNKQCYMQYLQSSTIS